MGEVAQSGLDVSWNKEKYVNKAIRKLDATSRWMIENGIREILTSPDIEQLYNKFADEFIVTPVTELLLRDEDEFPRFILGSLTVNYDINLLQRTQFEGTFYEFWMIDISSTYMPDTHFNYSRSCQFFVTETRAKAGIRKILKESDQFFHEYAVKGETVLNIDAKNDLKIRYKLNPWATARSYRNYTQLTHDKVVINDQGDYVLAP